MKGKLAFLLGMALGQCFVWGYGEFQTLRMVFSSWQGHPNGWRMAFDQTHNFAEKTAKNITAKRENCNCVGDDLKAIRALTVSVHCVKNFLQTSMFKENRKQYEAWLKALYCIAFDVASRKNPVECSKLKGLLDQLSSDSSIESLFEDAEFWDRIKRIGVILTDAIDWGEEE